MEHKILWTGGWDSTFRILDLVLNKKERVQPYYVLDHRRKSTSMELKTMEKIKTLMNEQDPHVKERINDTITIDMTDIPGNNKITRSYNDLASMSHLGDQADWLARFADSMQMEGLELSVHLDDNVMGFIENDVELIDNGNDPIYKLTKNPSNPALNIFQYYHFPLLGLTKLDMGKMAKASGFKHIMEETWFCHIPRKDGTPCGLCNPCKYTREEGLGRRVPTPTLVQKSTFFFMEKYKRGKGKIKKIIRAI